MKATGIVRRIDDLGRVVIPKEMRRSTGIKDGDPMEIWVDGENIVFRRYRPGCMLCGETTGTVEIDGVRLCAKCARKIVERVEELGNA
jgi:transcriptional pleiotropic regulator of transition state genes